MIFIGARMKSLLLNHQFPDRMVWFDSCETEIKALEAEGILCINLRMHIEA
jgi:hypothetical protein